MLGGWKAESADERGGIIERTFVVRRGTLLGGCGDQLTRRIGGAPFVRELQASLDSRGHRVRE